MPASSLQEVFVRERPSAGKNARSVAVPRARLRAEWSDLLPLALDHDSQIPIFRQIYLLLRDAIVSNTLAPGSKLPSSRQLAERLRVSRTSAVTAYDQLLAEGYVVSRSGSGTYVSDDVPPAIVSADRSRQRAGTASRAAISRAGEHYRGFASRMSFGPRIPFMTGCCSIDAKTVEDWRRIGGRHMRNFDPVNLAYADPGGDLGLRREIAAYLRAARAVRCADEQVIILSGAQQVIDISIRTLLDPGDPVWVEDPGYLPVREALIAAGTRIVPVPVDSGGLNVAAGIKAAKNAKAAFVTPSHQFPTGIVMNMARRLELLAWAESNGAWIFEDDYDSEFRYGGRPLSSLQGLDHGERVIYAGTLSKVLFPGLRIGFAVVPPQLVDAFRAARFLTDRFPPSLQQSMTGEFMREGLLTGHIRRMRERYREARDVVVEAIRRHMGDLVDIEVPDCGIQLVIHFRAEIPDTLVAEAAREQGVIVRPVSTHYVEAKLRQGLVLGYSGFDNHQLRKAAADLGRVLRQVMRDEQTAPLQETLLRRSAPAHRRSAVRQSAGPREGRPTRARRGSKSPDSGKD
jgi:GntR family transcriptional regulator/MocR family aminotransferase